jgi:hypothetical protein
MLIKVNEPPARRGVERAHVPAKWTPVRRQEHAPNDESRARSDSAGMERALAHEQRANAGGVAENERPAEGTT